MTPTSTIALQIGVSFLGGLGFEATTKLQQEAIAIAPAGYETYVAPAAAFIESWPRDRYVFSRCCSPYDVSTSSMATIPSS